LFNGGRPVAFSKDCNEKNLPITLTGVYSKMAEIRSALEIAMEKADRLGKAGTAELEANELLDRGRRIAARYLQDEETDLRSGLHDSSAAQLSFLLKGAVDILVRNIVLPRDKEQWATINKALKGLVELKGSSVQQVIPEIRQLLEAYEQTSKRYYEQVKSEMQRKLGSVQKAIAQQYGMEAAANINVDALPEFQQEWSRISADIKEQFERQLTSLKTYLE
jgi:hypothetical protein